MMSFNDPGNMGDRIFSGDVTNKCKENARFRLVKIDITAELKKDKPFSVTFSDYDGHTVHAQGDLIPETAINIPIDEDRLKEQITKLGSSVYFPGEVNIDLDEGLSLPISEINAVRRHAAELLTKERTKITPARRFTLEYRDYTERKDTGIEITAEVNDREQLEAAVKHNIQKIYIPHTLYEYAKKNVSPETLLIIKPPAVIHDDMPDFQVPAGAKAVMVNYPYQAEKYKNYECYGNYRLNIMNNYAADFYKDKLKRITLSPEMNLKEIKNFLNKSDDNVELIAYGRLALMTMRACPGKLYGKCRGKKDNIFSLKDRMGEIFPILCGDGCISSLLNSKPVYMADKMDDLKNLKINSIRLIFTVEKFFECDKIINMYKYALKDEKADVRLIDGIYTRGHFYRGVD